MLPDVAAYFSRVQLTQDGADHVLVRGTIGRAPSIAYKVPAIFY